MPTLRLILLLLAVLTMTACASTRTDPNYTAYLQAATADTLQPALAEAGVALEPFAAWSPWIRVLVTVLVIAGAALAIYGRLDVPRRTGV